jgi:molybdopterin-guanine dinucleotide biosynthesis protein A
MSRPKALLPWYGATVLERVVDVLHEVVDHVVVVTSGAFELPALDATVVQDSEPGRGPLGGIRDGLRKSAGASAFVASVDTPFLSARFVRAMLAFGRSAACELDGFVQPLCAVYETRYAGEADALLRQGRGRPLWLLESASFRRVSPDELPELDSLRGFNTPDEYLQALRASGQEGEATLEFFGRSRLRVGRAQLCVPPGTLGQALALARADNWLAEGDVVSPRYLVSLNGTSFVRELHVPIGPGDQVIIMDSAVGG